MDPANERTIHSTVELQGAMLGRHDEELTATRRVVETLAAQLSDLSTQVQLLRRDPPPPPRSPDAPEPRVNNPRAIVVSPLNVARSSRNVR